jgi:hypothetical protein
MRNRIFATGVATSLVVLVSGAHAEIGGLAPGGLAGPRGLGTLNAGPELGAPPHDPMPRPQIPTQQWVPPQREYDPAIGRDLSVPPHYADETPGGRLIHPPMTIPGSPVS